MEQATNAAMASKFRNAGQTCVCADRFIIHEAVADKFIKLLKEKTSKLKVGHGLMKDTTMGPLISTVDNVRTKVEEAVSEGANCILGGAALVDLGPNFFEPTILVNVKPTSRIWHTETFGPVVAITTFQHDDEAVKLANDSRSGLASYLCTKDIVRALNVGER